MSDSTLQHMAHVSPLLVDEAVGIVEYVMDVPPEAGSPNFFHVYARACDTRAFCPQRNSRDAGGASVDRDRALGKAIGEAVERYCAAIFLRDEFPLCSFDSAACSCVEPEEFALYSPAQYTTSRFPFVPFTRDTRVRWTPALDLTTGQTVSVPAAAVFVPYFPDVKHGEARILQPASTGLACHVGPVQAALSAVCEAIERDAFMVTWQARLSPPRIVTASLSDANRDMVERFECIGGHVDLFNMAMDHGVPAVMSVLRLSEPDAPALVFAAAAHPDPEEAIRKSLEELAHSCRFCRLLKASRPTFAACRDFANVTDRDSHVALYCDHANASLAAFLFASHRRIECQSIRGCATGNVQQELVRVAERIAAVHHRVLLADVTTDDVRPLGLSVMRAIIPGFQRMCVGHDIRILGGSRLWEVPQSLGYKGITRRTGDNPAPHPLP